MMDSIIPNSGGSGVLPAAPEPVPQPAARPVSFRKFDDVPAMRKNIYDNALEAASSLKPVSFRGHTLSLQNVGYVDPEERSLADEKEAFFKGRTLSRRLRGDWILQDPEGKVLDTKKATVAAVPYVTKHGTFIINGKHWSLANQFRLKPGVFARIKSNGDIESHVNALPGKGASHRLYLEPESGVFRLNIRQSSLPLIPVLRAMGVNDSELREAWGDKVLQANAAKDNPKIIDKLYSRFVRSNPADPPPSHEDKTSKLLEELQRVELDPEISSRTLKSPYSKMGKDVLLAATSKLLRVSEGKEAPDERDHMAYQTLVGPEDLLAERIRTSGRVLQPVLWKSFLNKNLQNMPTGVLTKAVLSAVVSSGLGQPLEEVSPLDVLDQLTRATRMGVGGLPSSDAIPDESRAVLPSQMGFIDPVRTPESTAAGVDMRVASGAWKGSDGRVYSQFIDARSGDKKMLHPGDLADKVLAFPGEMSKSSKYARVIDSGKIRYRPKDAVDYVLPSFEAAFNQLANLTPLKSAIKPQRVAMGSRMMTQALSLVNPESPLVQLSSDDESGKSYEEALGEKVGAVRSLVGGVVEKVDDDHVLVRDPVTGERKKHELYNNYQLNRKSVLHNTAVVQPGDTVKPGQLLARSNFTDSQGKVAAGLNARAAYVAWDGKNFEDGILVSQGLANRLESIHMYPHEVEWDSSMKKGKSPFVSLFPGTFDKRQMDSMSDEGVVKKGTKLQKGDPIVLIAQQRDLTHKQAGRGTKNLWKDGSITWEHESPGEVTESVMTDRGAVVSVKSLSKLKIGDKISGTMGDKGITSDILPDGSPVDDEDDDSLHVAGVLPDAEMPTDESGKPYEILINPLGVITRCYDVFTELYTGRGWTSISDVRPQDKLIAYLPVDGKLAWRPQRAALYHVDYSGPMVCVSSSSINFCVTPNHSVCFRDEPPGEGFDGTPLLKSKAGKLFGRHVWLPVPAEPGKVGKKNGWEDVTWAEVKPEDWKEEQYSGPVWCPSVASGFVLTRRRNKMVCLGNTNPAQVPLALLSKIAAKTGKPYILKDWEGDDLLDFARNESKKHGVTDKESIVDPRSGRKIKNVLTGVRYVLKLQHLSEGKSQARGTGGYSAEEQPARGSGEGGKSKKMALQDLNALLSHNAIGVIKDAMLYRGQQNFDLMSAFLRGQSVPEPRVPLVHRKFFALLQGSGINPVREGGQIQLGALTAGDIDDLTQGRTIKNSQLVEWKKGDLRPVPGGLFDVGITGGHSGDVWSAIPLSDRLPNPVMEEPMRRLLGLTSRKFEGVISGTEELNGKTGPEALYDAVDKLDIQKELERTRDVVKNGKKTAKDEAIRKLGYLKTLDRIKGHPRDWFWDKAPVLPAAFRPISVMGSGKNASPLIADPNYLYQELWEANDSLSALKKHTTEVGAERLSLYKALKAAVGTDDPIGAKNQERGVKGLLQQLMGESGKYSFMQKKILGRTVDMVGRGVIMPDPDLDIDSVGIPENKAWDVYGPFVVHRLAREGVNPLDAVQAVEDQNDRARKAMLAEMDVRPVIVTRAPVLHKYGEMAFWPKLVHGDSIKVNPNIVKGFGADFDGDQKNYHVPFSDEAVKDAVERMLPSKNLLSVKDKKAHYLPLNEYAGGLYHASSSRDDKKPEMVFASWKDAMAAYRRGDISTDTRVVVHE